ncbi:MAG: helix-turn-helix transcriptional regulator [Selenomonadaceae bacterium]|nr:helix-turn-helix transcriptional regulator [Selenomonadaceae bacterium]
MSINGRLKLLRKDQGLNQGEFGTRIGLKQGAISKMEQEGNAVIDQNIRLICDTFNVNENWLRTGEGDMYAETNETVLTQLAAQYHLEGERLELIRNFLLLTDEQQETIVRAACIVAEANKKAMETTNAESAANILPMPPVSESVTPPAVGKSPPESIPPAPTYYTPPGYEIIPQIEEKVVKYRARLYAEEIGSRALSTSPPIEPSSEDDEEEPLTQKSRP